MNEPLEPGEERRFPIKRSVLMRRAMRLLCPICARGRPFPGLLQIEEQCDHCDYRYTREPGYFLGAIYFNYGVTGVFVSAWAAVATFVWELDFWLQILLPITFLLAFPIWFLRYSRALWMAFDLSWDPLKAGESKLYN